eukprot:gene2717-3913_t
MSENEIFELIPVSKSFKSVILEESTTLGRLKSLPENCRFTDSRISTKHCSLYIKENRLYIKDSSTNGTFINGNRIDKDKEVELKNDDILCLSVPSSLEGLPSYKISIKNYEATPLIDQTLEIEEGFLKRTRDEEEPIEEEKPLKSQKIDDKSQQELSQEDPMEENLLCPICSDIFYKCITVLPCLHNFCAPCYSSWMKSQNLHENCPQCRQTVDEVRKNHGIQNFVDTYLKLHPKKQKSEEEIKELEKENTITDEFLRNQVKLRSNNNGNGFGGGFGFGGFTGGFHPINNNDTYYSDDEEEIFSEEEYPDNSTTCQECIQPGTDGFQCSRDTPNHVTCSACYKLMPLRDPVPQDRPQECMRCQKYFCEQYFGNCTGLNQTGQFKKIKDHKFSVLPTDSLNGNQYEREILLNYMARKSYSTNRLFVEICRKIDDGTLSTSDYDESNDVSTSDYVCNFCVTEFFSSMIYDFRLSIPEDQFPKEVIQRPDCWYGRECNTQKHNLMHAKKFNHICENKKK